MEVRLCYTTQEYAQIVAQSDFCFLFQTHTKQEDKISKKTYFIYNNCQSVITFQGSFAADFSVCLPTEWSVLIFCS